MPANHSDLEKRLWDAADELRANSKLKSSEYSVPVLGLIFLRFADHKFAQAKTKLVGKSTGRRKIGKADYQAQGVLYLPEQARFANLLKLPEGADIGKAINEAMKAIEDENEDLKDVLPQDVQSLWTKTLSGLAARRTSPPMLDGHRGRRLRQDLRVLPRQVRHVRRARRAASSSRPPASSS